jgi:hypothetical protein
MGDDQRHVRVVVEVRRISGSEDTWRVRVGMLRMWTHGTILLQYFQSKRSFECVHVRTSIVCLLLLIRVRLFTAESHNIRPPVSTNLQTKLNLQPSGPEAIKRALVRWIAEDNRPLSIAETDAFKRLYATLTKGGKPLGRKMISQRIDSLTEKVKAKLKTELQTVETVAATTDGWLSPNSVEYVCAVVHYIDSEWRLKYQCIGVHDLNGDSTAASIKAKLESMFFAYGVSPITVTCDQGKNYMNAVDSMFRVERIICAAHNINLAVQDMHHDPRTKLEEKNHVQGTPSPLLFERVLIARVCVRV